MKTARLASVFLLLTAVAAVGPTVASRILESTDTQQGALRIGILYGYYLVSAGLCFALLATTGWRRLIELRREWLLIAAAIFLLISIAAGGFQLRPMMIMAPAFAVMIFYHLPASAISTSAKPVGLFLGLVSALPVLIYFLANIDFAFWLSESFRGFGDSRSDYAYIAGLAAMLAITSNSKLLWFISIPTLFGLSMAASRAALISIFVAIFVIVAISAFRKKYIRACGAILAGIFIIMSPNLISEELGRRINFSSMVFDAQGKSIQIGLLADYGGRTEIYANALADAKEDWLLGAGNYFQTTHLGQQPIEAHNAILQSVMNFGVIVTVLWLAFLATLFWRTSLTGKATLAFWFIYGQFQPGSDAFLFVPESILPLLIASCCMKEAAVTRTPASCNLIKSQLE